MTSYLNLKSQLVEQIKNILYESSIGHTDSNCLYSLKINLNNKKIYVI